VPTLNRRDLLLLAINRKSRSTELSCERLYMKYCDSQLDNSTPNLFQRLAVELQAVDKLTLLETSWMTCQDFKERLEPLLVSFRARGGKVTYGSR
jgi:hypothetical protein